MLAAMDQLPPDKPDYSADPSPPRAPFWARLLVLALLLGLAFAAIWWIDRGATLTNTHP
jgi:hypothetical protein